MKKNKAKKFADKRASHRMPDGSTMSGASHGSGAMGPMGPQRPRKQGNYGDEGKVTQTDLNNALRPIAERQTREVLAGINNRAKAQNPWSIMAAQERYNAMAQKRMLLEAQQQQLEQGGRDFAGANPVEYSNLSTPQNYRDLGRTLQRDNAPQNGGMGMSESAVNWANMAAEARRRQEENRQWLMRQQMLQNYGDGSYA
jgi:hypothetical protein